MHAGAQQQPGVVAETIEKSTRVLYNNCNGDWTAFSHPDVMAVLYVKNFIIPTTYTFIYNNSAQRFNRWSSSSTYTKLYEKL